MSVYNRKGGSGKAGNLRQQFNYYKNQLKKRFIREEAFNLASGGTPEQQPYNLFKHYDYDSIMKNGITRKQGWETVTITGEEAIKIQIESFKNRASKSYQSDVFISNYISAMIEVEFDNDYILEAEELLKSLSSDALSIMIKRGTIPQIAFIYNQDSDEQQEYIMDQLRFAVKNKPTTKELREIRQTTKRYQEILKDKYKNKM